MDAEAKNFEGLKGQKQIIRKVKAGSSNRKRNKRAWQWLMLFEQCCIKRHCTRALARTVFTEILWMMLLAIDFQL
jgi:hypothetical protein